MDTSAGLGEVTGACSQAQKESSRSEGKPSHWAAVMSKNDSGAAVNWAKKGCLEVLCEESEVRLFLAYL